MGHHCKKVILHQPPASRAREAAGTNTRNLDFHRPADEYQQILLSTISIMENELGSSL